MEPLQMLTLIADETLTAALEKEIVELGAKGYTLSKVMGRSPRHLRDNPWDGENVKIEILVNPDATEAILQHVKQKYFGRYAMIAYHYPVHVSEVYQS
ncbi:MAG: transcriptional regulator [Bacteroidetes bacterium]|nr:transcriptional regulator [Bacteroidota bacterium]